MKVLFYFGHPAQYLFAKNIIRKLKDNDVVITIIIKSKDVLETLLINDKISYFNILPEGRADSTFGIFIGLVKRIIRLLSIIRKNKPDVFVGTDPSIAQVAYMFRKKCYTTLEDDITVIPRLAKLTYPFTSHIIAPNVCDVGKWNFKKIGYNGFMKLAYLHKNYFVPDINIINPDFRNAEYLMIRLSKLSAHHDGGIKGIGYVLVDEIISICNKYKIRVLINSEIMLPLTYLKYSYSFSPNQIHHYLSFAKILISDSQSMSVEAALLGTPSIRVSSFKNKISVLNELEDVYGLTYCYMPFEQLEIIIKLLEFLENKTLKNDFQIKRNKLLSEKIDVTEFVSEIILHTQIN